MTFRDNPFITGGFVPPEYFVGRQDVVRHCYSKLAGRKPTSIAINGELGIGKTSLLYYLRDRATQEKWRETNLYVYIYCPEIESFSPDNFYYYVLKQIIQFEEYPDIQKHAQQLLDENEIDYQVFRDFLGWLKEQDRTLVLFLDGFAWIIGTDTSDKKTIGDFLSHLRAMTNARGYSFVLVTATHESLPELCEEIVRGRPESEFYNGFSTQVLRPFNADEFDALLAFAHNETGFNFDEADRRFLKQMAGTHPAILQIAASHLFDARQNALLNEQIYKEVVEGFEVEASRYFGKFWEKSSILEQTLIILLILDHLASRDTIDLELSPSSVSEVLHKYKQVLINLSERGLAEESDSIYRIFSGVFARWLVREVSAGKKDPHEDEISILEVSLQQVWAAFKELAPNLTINPQNVQLGPREHEEGTLAGLPAHYRLEKKVGSGAFGTVYKVFDEKLQRVVAIKQLRSQPTLPLEEVVDRLMKEAQAVAKLQHPNIVILHDALDTANSEVYLIMEFLEGQSLASLLKEQGAFALKEVISWIENAAIALDYAHTQGVIHRDIKPANLMITTDGILKLTDFGIAKVTDDDHLSDSSGLKGTWHYMSPEQVKDQTPLDGRSDLFSLVSVVFEILTGVTPWSGKPPFDLMNDILNGEPRSLLDYDVKGADILMPVFKKGFAKAPDDRYQTGQEFVEALKQSLIIMERPILNRGTSWVVAVGINDYEEDDNYPNLSVCVDDVNTIRKNLLKNGYNDNNIRVLSDQEELPTRNNIMAALQSVANAAEKDDLLLFYYSGHGDEADNTSYLVARDSRGVILKESAVSMSWITKVVTESSARAKVIILDACHSGVNTGQKGLDPMSSKFIQRVYAEAEGVAILASCKQNEYSYEWQEQGCSVFTYYLLEALNGEADKERKGFVTVQDLSRHLNYNVKVWATKKNLNQTPTLEARVAGDIVISFYN